MIAADDPRHGTNPGYNAGCRQPCCKHAHMVYKKRRALGYERHYINATGTRRRLQALAALGHSLVQISLKLGHSRSYAAKLMENPAVRSDNAQAIADVYEQLCMTLAVGPLAERSRRAAAEKGWLPPLAWDDIDNDPEPPKDAAVTVDEVKVLRVLRGERLKCNRAEKVAVLEAWNGSLTQLNKNTGWNIERIKADQKEVA